MYLHTSSIKKWDICAGDAIIRSVGGSLIDLTEGIPLNYSYGTDPLHKGGILMSVRSTYSIFSRIRKYLKP